MSINSATTTTTTACILAANAVTDAALWKERTGEGQDIHVDLRKAWIEQSAWQIGRVGLNF